MPGSDDRLHAVHDARLCRNKRQSGQRRQHRSFDQCGQRGWKRGRALRVVPVFRDEFGDGRYEWPHERLCSGHLRGGFVRLHAFHATRFRHDRRNASQWGDHFGDNRQDGPLHHVPVGGDQSRLHLIFRRNFPAGHMRGRGLRLHAFHATAGLALQ